jgi:hypothetical protein
MLHLSWNRNSWFTRQENIIHYRMKASWNLDVKVIFYYYYCTLYYSTHYYIDSYRTRAILQSDWLSISKILAHIFEKTRWAQKLPKIC